MSKKPSLAQLYSIYQKYSLPVLAVQEVPIEKASSYNPCMIIDFATLTGAARVALGEDLPAYFCNNETFAKKIENLNKEKLRCWRLPLYSPYLSKIKSQVADLSNASLDGMAGSITAALFLQEFLNNQPFL